MAVMKGTQMAAEAIRSAGKKGVVINTASIWALVRGFLFKLPTSGSIVNNTCDPKPYKIAGYDP